VFNLGLLTRRPVAAVFREDREMQASFDVISDPGHAWARVPFRVLRDLGIVEKITTYSYVKNGNAYLEEDCDLSTLIAALKDRGIVPKFRERVTRERQSRIRGYFCYTPHVVNNYFLLGGK
jgi:hypothetical protein